MAQLWLYGQPETLAPQQGQWVDRFRGFQERDRAAAMHAAQANAQLAAQQQQADEAAMQRDFANRVDLSRYANNQGFAERAEVENTRRFNVSTNLSEKQIEAYSSSKKAASVADAEAELKALEAADNWATFRAPTAATAGENISKSQAAINEAQRAFTTQRDALRREMPPGVELDKTGETFVARKDFQIAPQDKTRVDSANERLAALTSGLREAGNNLKFHTQTFDEMRKEAQGYGLTVDLDGGRGVIFNPFTKKQYRGPQPPVLRPTATGSNLSNPVMGDLRMAERDVDLSRFAPTVASRLMPTTPRPLPSSARWDMPGAIRSSDGPSAPRAPFREGQRVLNKRTGTYFIIRNGQPVPE